MLSGEFSPSSSSCCRRGVLSLGSASFLAAASIVLYIEIIDSPIYSYDSGEYNIFVQPCNLSFWKCVAAVFYRVGRGDGMGEETEWERRGNGRGDGMRGWRG